MQNRVAEIEQRMKDEEAGKTVIGVVPFKDGRKYARKWLQDRVGEATEAKLENSMVEGKAPEKPKLLFE